MKIPSSDRMLISIVRDVITKTPALASEEDVFDLEAERIWEHFRGGGKPDTALCKDRLGDFEFSEPAPVNLMVVGLLWSTFETAHRVKSGSLHGDESVLEHWTARLVASGFAPALAEHLARTHGGSLTQELRL